MREEVVRVAHEGSRMETGPVQFGDDWPGVFIRGDDAFAWAMGLEEVLDGSDAWFVTRAQLRALVETLRGCSSREV